MVLITFAPILIASTIPRAGADMIEKLLLFELIHYGRVGSQVPDRRNSNIGAVDWDSLTVRLRGTHRWVNDPPNAHNAHKSRNRKMAWSLALKWRLRRRGIFRPSFVLAASCEPAARALRVPSDEKTCRTGRTSLGRHRTVQCGIRRFQCRSRSTAGLLRGCMKCHGLLDCEIQRLRIDSYSLNCFFKFSACHDTRMPARLRVLCAYHARTVLLCRLAANNSGSESSAKCFSRVR